MSPSQGPDKHVRSGVAISGLLLAVVSVTSLLCLSVLFSGIFKNTACACNTKETTTQNKPHATEESFYLDVTHDGVLLAISTASP